MISRRLRPSSGQASVDDRCGAQNTVRQVKAGGVY